MAMTNTIDGGKLIIGFDEKNNSFNGPKNWLKTFDQTKIMNSVKKYTTGKIVLQVIKKHNFLLNKKTGDLAIIYIHEFNDVPVIAKDGKDNNNKVIFNAADIFIRTDRASTEKIPDSSIMKELIHRATLKNKKEIIDEIRSLLDDNMIKPTKDYIKDYETEISDFENTHLKINLIPTLKKGIWSLNIIPILKKSELFFDLRKIIIESQSRHRGYPLPILTEPNTQFKDDYLDTFFAQTFRTPFYECWRLHENGLFCWARNMFENENENNEKLISKVNSIWTITELLLFASRVYEINSKDLKDLHIVLKLTNTNNRKYIIESSPYNNPVDLGTECKTNIIKIEKNISISSLKYDLENQINNIIKKLDDYFNVQNYDEKHTRLLINEILNMKLPSNY